MKRLALIILAAVAFTAAAVAQTTPAPPAPASFLEQYRPLLQDIANIAWTALIGYVAWYVRQRFGIELNAERRDTFQIATTNAAGVLKASGGDMSKAVEYLKEAAPDAIKHFEIPDEKLSEKIEAKAGVLESGTTIVNATTVSPSVDRPSLPLALGIGDDVRR